LQHDDQRQKLLVDTKTAWMADSPHKIVDYLLHQTPQHECFHYRLLYLLMNQVLVHTLTTCLVAHMTTGTSPLPAFTQLCGLMERDVAVEVDFGCRLHAKSDPCLSLDATHSLANQLLNYYRTVLVDVLDLTKIGLRLADIPLRSAIDVLLSKLHTQQVSF
jgi:hypothetical protein